jgi:uncharacterized membrane protein YpjA
MLRIFALCLPTLIIFVGIVALFLSKGLASFLLALALVGIGVLSLWCVEKKTIHHLDEDTWLNRILNTEDGQE